MELAVGEILEGKVTGITKFGAFVSLGGGKSGMVHISEVAHTYVSDIADHLTVGQDVKVKIIAMENGKINLSIKKCTEPPQQAPRTQSGRDQNQRKTAPRPGQSAASKEPLDFEDRLKRFMDESNSKLASSRQYADHRSKRRR